MSWQVPGRPTVTANTEVYVQHSCDPIIISLAAIYAHQPS